MANSDLVVVPPQRLATLRIIHASLLLGCAVFGIIAMQIRDQPQIQVGPPAAPAQPFLCYVGLGKAGLMALLFFTVPPLLLNAWRRRLASQTVPPAPPPPSGYREHIDQASARVGLETPYWEGYTTQFIVRAALLEATIFFNLVAYLIEGQTLSLGVAGGFFVGLALLFPTEGGMRRWLGTQREAIDQLRRNAA